MNVQYSFKPYIPFILVGILLSTCLACKKESDNNDSVPSLENTVTDIDGNVYHSVIIGGQEWMAENLKVTRYRNGDPIYQVTDTSKADTVTRGEFSWYADELDNKRLYGGLYNWHAVYDSRDIAPVGWHVPTDAEWTILTDYLGGLSVAGGKLKQAGTREEGNGYWYAPNTGATDSIGFKAIPSGTRGFLWTYYGLGWAVGFWTSTQDNSNSELACYRLLKFDKELVYEDHTYKSVGHSVRCVKD